MCVRLSVYPVHGPETMAASGSTALIQLALSASMSGTSQLFPHTVESWI